MNEEDSISSPSQHISDSSEAEETENMSGLSTDTGISFEEVECAPGCGPQLPPVRPSRSHTVLYQVPLNLCEPPKPYPSHLTDKWDEHHVRMPYSSRNLYPTYNEDGSKKSLQQRWEIIEAALLRDFKSAQDIKEAILTYNARYRDVWTFAALTAFIEEDLDEEERLHVLNKILPSMVQLALRLPQLVTQPIPLQRQSDENKTQTISLSQLQVASLLANAFFCTFPCRNHISNKSGVVPKSGAANGQEYKMFPGINFHTLFEGRSSNSRGKGKAGPIPKYHRVFEKLRCILCYFRRVTRSDPVGTLTFSRKSVSPSHMPEWCHSPKKLPKIYASRTGTIEDGQGCLQVDFADKYIGGGILGHGCVQEEIRFAAYPELIVSMLWSEAMADNEAIVITGCEQFSETKGYSDTFEWNGAHKDSTPRDVEGRRCAQVVAIDATRFFKPSGQYELPTLQREINKAYVGYLADSVPSHAKPCGISTGNWGCGVFRGDARLKCLLQMMAAAQAGRTTIAYYTFGNSELHNDILKMSAFLKEKDVSVGQLWTVVSHFHNTRRPTKALYDFIYESLSRVPVSPRRKTQLSAIQKPEETKHVPFAESEIDAMFDDDFDMEEVDNSSTSSTTVKKTDFEVKTKFNLLEKLDEAEKRN